MPSPPCSKIERKRASLASRASFDRRSTSRSVRSCTITIVCSTFPVSDLIGMAVV